MSTSVKYANILFILPRKYFVKKDGYSIGFEPIRDIICPEKCWRFETRYTLRTEFISILLPCRS